MLEELKALIKTPRLWVTMIGVALIPSLYNLSFLGSMWNPYGRLDDLPVAVVNHDKPATLNDKKIAIGDNMVDSMSKNKALDYHFVSEEKAEKGLQDGDYYMVIDLPEDLSEKASTLLTDDPEQLTIPYQTTAGRSFVASKMSETAMSKLKATVSENITETYTKAVFKSMKSLQGGLKEASSGGDKLLSGSQKLQEGSQTITDNLNVAASGSQALADGASTLSSGLTTYTNGVGQLSGGIGTLSSGLNTYTNGVSQLSGGIGSLSSGLNTYTNGVSQLSGGIDSLSSGLNTYTNGVSQLASGTTSLSSGINAYVDGVNQLSSGLNELNGKSQDLTNGIAQLQSESSSNLQQLLSGATELNNVLQSLQSQVNGISIPDVSQLQSSLSSLSQLSQQLSTISSINRSDLAAVRATSAYQSLSPEYRAQIDSAISNSSGAATANQLTSKISAIQSQISAIQSQLSSLQSLSSQLANLSTLLNNVSASGRSQQLVNGLTDFKSGLEAEKGIPKLVDGISQYTAAVSQLTDGANAIVAKNDQLTGGASQLQSGAEQLASNNDALTGGAAKLQSGADQLVANNGQITGGAAKLQSGADQLVANNGQITGGVAKLQSGADQLVANNGKLTSGVDQLQSGAEQLASGAGQLAAGSETLTTGLGTLTDGISTLSSSLSKASKQLSVVSVKNKNAKLVSDPVTTKRKDIDTVKNNGIGMAPYMIAVSLMVVALSTNVIFASSLSGLPVKNRWEWAKQKIFINGLISTAGSLILYGAIQFLGFEANYEWRTIFVILLGGWTLMALVTALIGWNRRYGSFISLIILVLQLGSAGGSYPIELSPKFFQVIHPYLPMSYIVTALRETISMTGSIGQEVGVLVGFLIAFMIMGLIIYKQPKAEA